MGRYKMSETLMKKIAGWLANMDEEDCSFPELCVEKNCPSPCRECPQCVTKAIITAVADAVEESGIPVYAFDTRAVVEWLRTQATDKESPRQAFLNLPMEERCRILGEQAEGMVEHYQELEGKE